MTSKQLDWNLVKTASYVARLGTVSSAARALGIHHASVIRHIEQLEAFYGVKLFHRHSRGYKTTPQGDEILRVATACEGMFSRLQYHLDETKIEIEGDLTVTTLAGFSEIFLPILLKFQKEHPKVNLRYLTSPRIFKLEYAEAHIAIRAGAQPDSPDDVVQHLVDLPYGLYATRDYIAQNHLPLKNIHQLAGHKFIGLVDDEGEKIQHNDFVRNFDLDRASLLSNEFEARKQAILMGAGIGALPHILAQRNANLVEVLPQKKEWLLSLWLVTHMDVHRTAKIQKATEMIRSEIKALCALQN